MATQSMLAQATVWEIESDTPATFIPISEVTDWDGLGGGEASDIDATSLDSLAKEYRVGLADAGSASHSICFSFRMTRGRRRCRRRWTDS